MDIGDAEAANQSRIVEIFNPQEAFALTLMAYEPKSYKNRKRTIAVDLMDYVSDAHKSLGQEILKEKQASTPAKKSLAAKRYFKVKKARTSKAAAKKSAALAKA